MCPPVVSGKDILTPSTQASTTTPPLILDPKKQIPYQNPSVTPTLDFGTKFTNDPANTVDGNDFPPGWSVKGVDKREKEIEAFVDKVDTATSNFKNGIYMNELWPSIKIHGETIYKSTIETFNSSKGIPPKGIIPTELAMTVDGISDINIGEAFVIQKGVLPSKYDKFGFIVVGVDQTIKNNRWTTNIRAQTFNISEIANTEIETSATRITKFGFY